MSDNGMAGLAKNEGQLVLADGSASQSNDADLGKRVTLHVNTSGGLTKGPACRALLGKAGQLGTGGTLTGNPGKPGGGGGGNELVENTIMPAWNDVHGHRTFAGYILEKGNSYSIVRGSYNWNAANADAKKRGGHLATVTSWGEWKTICNIPEYTKEWEAIPLDGGVYAWGKVSFWLGGYQDPKGKEPDGGWKWVTGEPWGFDAWNFYGEPSDGKGGAPNEEHLQAWAVVDWSKKP